MRKNKVYSIKLMKLLKNLLNLNYQLEKIARREVIGLKARISEEL